MLKLLLAQILKSGFYTSAGKRPLDFVASTH